jgi:hypothetical protein
MSKEAIEKYFNSIVSDMASQNAKVPVSKFRSEVTQIEGKLYAPDWFQYMITGRGPGKQPPPDKMFAWVQRNPDVFRTLQTYFKYITEKGAAYIIGRKIGREGTQIWRGEKKGVDILGPMEKYMPELLATLVKNEAVNIATSLSKAIN